MPPGEGIRVWLSMLVSEGAGLKKQDWNGQNAFHLAAGNGNRDVVEWLLDRDPSLIKELTLEEQTALHYAARGNKKMWLSCCWIKGLTLGHRMGMERRHSILRTSRGMCDVVRLLKSRAVPADQVEVNRGAIRRYEKALLPPIGWKACEFQELRKSYYMPVCRVEMKRRLSSRK